LCIEGNEVGSLLSALRRGSLMTRDSIGRGTSIKKLKRRAKELRGTHGMPLSQALECAAIEAGFQNYHSAVSSLAKTRGSSEDTQFALAEKALQSMAAFAADEGHFDRMSEALWEIYAEQAGARSPTARPGLAEYALAIYASRDETATKLLATWLEVALADPALDAPPFGVNVGLRLDGGNRNQSPRACVIADVGPLANHAVKSLDSMGVGNPKIEFDPVALLALRPAPRGTMISDWWSVVQTACGNAEQRLNGGAPLNRTGRRPPDMGTGTGANYLLLGRATATPAEPGLLEKALEEVCWDGISVFGTTSRSPVELSPVELGGADILLSTLYASEVNEVASWLAMQVDALWRSSNVELRMVVRPGDLESSVMIEASLPNDSRVPVRTRRLPMGSHLFPCYLYAGLHRAFGDSVTYTVGD
jgi:hypothetical protein